MFKVKFNVICHSGLPIFNSTPSYLRYHNVKIVEVRETDIIKSDGSKIGIGVYVYRCEAKLKDYIQIRKHGRFTKTIYAGEIYLT